MAELDVQPKRSNPWWLWLLLALVVIAVLFFVLKKKDTTTVTNTVVSDTTKTVAVTQPDWNSVNFDSPKSNYEEVTEKDITVSGNDKYTIYTLGENILFATDKNAIQTSGDAKLKQIVASLNKRFKGATIGVFGSTDSTGTTSHNKQLGAERAAAVKTWLVQNGGLADDKVSIHSLGESKPVASNATAAGRQQNRNVQIVAFPDSTAKK